MKKLIALFLVFSLLTLSGNLYAKERHGAELVIEKKDGQSVRGELIAVKQASLLLLDSEGADVSVNVDNIRVVKIVKKSKALLYALSGFLVMGILVGILVARDPTVQSGEGGGWFMIGLAILGVPAAIVLGGIGAIVGIDKTIKIEGKSDSEIKEILENLRSKARIPNYQ